MRSFGTMLLAAWTLLCIYVFGRAATVPGVVRRVPRRVLFPVAGILWASFILAQTLGGSRAGAFLSVLESCGMNALAILFILAVPLLAVDVVTGFGLFARPQLPRLRGTALVIGGLLAGVALIQGLRPPVVREYEVRLPGLPAALAGTTVVALSDLHLGSLLGEKWLAERVAQVQALRPDLVVLLGDLFEGHGRPAAEFLPLLQRFAAPLGVWAVAGNHEFHGARGAGGPTPEQVGLTFLHDRWVEVRPGLVLAGVDDLTSRRRANEGGDPVRRLYPFFAGRYEVDGMTLIVSRGTGTWGPRLRLWYPGEILRVTLRPGA